MPAASPASRSNPSGCIVVDPRPSIGIDRLRTTAAVSRIYQRTGRTSAAPNNPALGFSCVFCEMDRTRCSKFLSCTGAATNRYICAYMSRRCVQAVPSIQAAQLPLIINVEIHNTQHLSSLIGLQVQCAAHAVSCKCWCTVIP